MIPFFVMMAIPSLLALTGYRKSGALLFSVFFLYWVLVGFRFHVGADWNGYVRIYGVTKLRPLSGLLLEREPLFQLLQWLAFRVGGGLILVNALSGLVFCLGLFAVAKRCYEPLLAIAVATPMLVIAFAMSATRQSLAVGIIFYLFATWDKRTTIGRIALVVLASLFHFSSLFVLILVALATRVPLTMRLAAAAFLAAIIGIVLYLAPETTSTYSGLYVSGSRKLNAPGAWVQVGTIAFAGLIYIAYQRPWRAVHKDNPLYHNIAIAALAAMPMIYVSSVGVYRFALFFWPMAMWVYSGLPALMIRSEARVLYRIGVIALFTGLLWGWLTFATNSAGWIPYQNWWLQPSDASLWR